MREGLMIERSRPSGAWIVSQRFGDTLETRRYYDYTKAEAIAEFIHEFPIRQRVRPVTKAAYRKARDARKEA